MRRIVYFIIAFVLWLLLTWPFGSITDGLILDWQVIWAGVAASVVVSVLFYEVLPVEYKFFFSPVRIFWLIIYIPVFFYYMIMANFDVLYRALHPQLPIKPGIVKIKTNLKTVSARVALANSITLTPGTMTVDLTDDGTLYIHWINVKSTDTEKATEYIAKPFEYFLSRIFE
jgi:multicomponent Na+:H+ antiporter subunit E